MQAVKLLSAIICSALIALCCAVLPSKTCFTGAESYRFYCGTSSADCREVYASAQNAALKKALLTNICGESAVYSPQNFDLDGFLAEHGGEIIFTEELSDSVNYYCTADLPYSVELYGAQINLHVCVKESAVIAGTPIIFGGF